MEYHAEGKIEEEGTIHFGDHEAHVAFNTDSEGVAFRDWWPLKGNELFSQYFNTNKEMYD